MECKLGDKTCIPCRGGVPPLKGKPLDALLRELGSDWEVVDEHHLQRTYRFPNFRAALAFVNRIGAVSEDQGHHPDIGVGWGYVSVTLYTHKIDGLTESDFILAAKFDRQLDAANSAG